MQSVYVYIMYVRRGMVGVMVRGGWKDDGGRGRKFTQVIQALLASPKASCQAGSRDWKNSSGWKKVCKAKAFVRRKASSRARIGGAESR